MIYFMGLPQINTSKHLHLEISGLTMTVLMMKWQISLQTALSKTPHSKNLKLVLMKLVLQLCLVLVGWKSLLLCR